MFPAPLRLAFVSLGSLAALNGCAGVRGDAFAPSPKPTAFAEVPYATWTDDESPYRLYPGDVLDVAVPSAPELNRTVTVQPDGRITLPLVSPVMASDRNVEELRATLRDAYGPTLVHPDVDLNVKTSVPLKVFVGGEVDKPGVYDMPGDINALQAVLMAGGFRTSGRRSEVVVLRRGPGGKAMMRVVNLNTAVFEPSKGTGSVALRRFDIVYVPKTRVSEVGQFVQQYVREVLPIQFSYAINGVANGGV